MFLQIYWIYVLLIYLVRNILNEPEFHFVHSYKYRYISHSLTSFIVLHTFKSIYINDLLVNSW